MANLRAIRKRISSVKSTQQITKAMKMVSAAKLRRSQDAITAARPYASKLREVVEGLAAKAGSEAHPLLEGREAKKLALVVVTSDRGLCGGFNSGLLRAVQRFIRENAGGYEEIGLFVVGRKGRDFFRRRGVAIAKEYVNVLGTLSYFNAETMSHDLIDAFKSGKYDEVRIAFNEFRSAISQTPRIEKLFPISILLLPAIREKTGKFFKKLLSPLTDLIPMDTKFTGQLGNSLFPFHGFQGYLSLEGCIMPSPHATHSAIPPFRLWQANMHLIPLSNFWGVLYNFTISINSPLVKIPFSTSNLVRASC